MSTIMETRGAGSVFDPTCPRCEGMLTPLRGWTWSCLRCGSVVEMCGALLIEVSTTPSPGGEPG